MCTSKHRRFLMTWIFYGGKRHVCPSTSLDGGRADCPLDTPASATTADLTSTQSPAYSHLTCHLFNPVHAQNNKYLPSSVLNSTSDGTRASNRRCFNPIYTPILGSSLYVPRRSKLVARSHRQLRHHCPGPTPPPTSQAVRTARRRLYDRYPGADSSADQPGRTNCPAAPAMIGSPTFGPRLS